MMRACALCLGGLAAFGVLEKPWNHSRSAHVECVLPSLGITKVCCRDEENPNTDFDTFLGTMWNG